MLPFANYLTANLATESDAQLQAELMKTEQMIDSGCMHYALFYMRKVRRAELQWRQIEKEAFEGRFVTEKLSRQEV